LTGSIATGLECVVVRHKEVLHLVPVASVFATACSIDLERTSEEVMWNVEDPVDAISHWSAMVEMRE
jgi:hypothetical protein